MIPGAGTINYTYDGFGQLLTQTNARSQQTTLSYLPDGRINSKTNPEGTYSYTYNSNKQLSGVTSPSSISRSYSYDNMGRIITSTETIPESTFTSSFTFDNKGRIATHTLPSGITETNTYNEWLSLLYCSRRSDKIHYYRDECSPAVDCSHLSKQSSGNA